MSKNHLDRRRLLTGAGLVGLAATAVTSRKAAAQTAGPEAPSSVSAPEPFVALNATEAAFVVAAVNTLIPADGLSPSGADCGVAVYIDRQLAGAYGAGARLYRDGPFLKGKPEHGYQLPLTPKAFFTAGVAAANAWTHKTHGAAFDALGEANQIATLKAFETGAAAFDGLNSADFFALLLGLTYEGFFADPLYGGNRDKAGWKMVGYPGLPATYAEAIAAWRGRRYVAEPQSIADFS